MAFTVSAIAAKDSAGSAITGGLLAGDIAGSGSGPWFLYHGLVDGVLGVNKAKVLAASTAAAAGDTPLVVALHPSSTTKGAGAADATTTRVTLDTGQLGSLGQSTMSAGANIAIASDQSWLKGLSNKAFSAAFTTLTRQANVTPYSAGDSISDNATAGSVTALSATISDVNDDPIFISDILVSSTDTGLAGKKLRAYLFNSDPTASSGVSGGDNLAYAQKKAGYIGSFMGYMETGFSDGTVGRLVPSFNETNLSQAGGFFVAKPTTGAKTLFIQYQAVEAFTPSANSTTIIGTARGWQGRAA